MDSLQESDTNPLMEFGVRTSRTGALLGRCVEGNALWKANAAIYFSDRPDIKIKPDERE